MNYTRNLLIAVIAGLIAAHTQLADAKEYGVIVGATVTWAPQLTYASVTNYDQVIRVDDGAIDVNGTHVVIPGQNIAIMPLGSAIPGVITALNPNASSINYATFDTTSSGASKPMQPSTSYYVYAAAAAPPATINFWGYVISTVPPWADGYPSSTVYYQMNFGGLQQPQVYGESSTTSSLVYLGSFITGANGRMVGFNRTGEQVFLAMTIAGATNYPANIVDQQFVATPTFPAAPKGELPPNGIAPYPVDVKATFPAGIVPATATALIVNMLLSNSQLSNGQTGQILYILDPQLTGMNLTVPMTDSSPGATCSATILTMLPSTTTIAPTTTSTTIVVPIAQRNPVVNIGACWPPIGTLNVIYQGYVEPVHHLAYVHP